MPAGSCKLGFDAVVKNSSYGLKMEEKGGWMVCNGCTCSWEVVHRKVGGIVTPHYNTLSSLVY